jgi:hypothetical protein
LAEETSTKNEEQKMGKKVRIDEKVATATINLQEVLPADHISAGTPRYGITQGGKGRFDRLTMRDVPADVVAATLQVQEQMAEEKTVAA